MTQKEKQLLFIDLCARLPYGIKVQVYYEDISFSGYFDETVWLIDNDAPFHVNDRWIEYIKPYLRPMSSMTEEEKKECCAIFNNCMYQFEVDKYGDIRSTKETVERENIYYDIELMDEWMKWLNSHHFDYRGLIEKGLAIEAPEDMYK